MEVNQQQPEQNPNQVFIKTQNLDIDVSTQDGQQSFTIIVEYENFIGEENQLEKINCIALSDLSVGQDKEKISISILIQKLQALDYDFKNYQVFYKGADEFFTYAGTVPQYRDEIVPLAVQNFIHLKVRKAINSVSTSEAFANQSFSFQSVTPNLSAQIQASASIQQQGSNESIPQLSEDQIESRSLNQEEGQKSNNRQTLSYEEAAIQLGFNKIILYEWYQRLRDGVKCGFNLVNHRDDESQVLKNYLKYHKEVKKMIDSNDKDQSKYERLVQKSTSFCTVNDCCKPPPFNNELT